MVMKSTMFQADIINGNKKIKFDDIRISRVSDKNWVLDKPKYFVGSPFLKI